MHIEAAEDQALREHKRNASDMSTEDLLLISPVSNEKRKSEKVLVCTPDPALIRVIYLPLLAYVHEIQELMKGKPGQPNTFEEFLSKHVKDVFLAKGHNRSLQMTIETLSKNHDAWRAIVSPEDMKQYGLSRPLLQSTVLVENSECLKRIFIVIISHCKPNNFCIFSEITETKSLIQDLPNYSEELLRMVCSLLKTYRETCQAAYRGIVQPETEDKRIYSVAWLKDEDICRFLKYAII